MQEHVLVVDDDKEIVRVVRAYLEQAGYQVSVAYDGEHALHILKRERPPLVILDLMLPDRDGLDITRTIRSDAFLANTYIIMLTARVEDMDRVVGLEMGADDYITKPFNPREVVARVRSGFRRKTLDSEHTKEKILSYQQLRIDTVKRHVTINDDSVELTPTEYDLLVKLMERPGIPFRREDLLQNRESVGYESLERTLDSHIRNLRKKLENDPSKPEYIQTVYGIGYRLGEP